ncbi:ATP-binding protein [Georgenia sp. SUBG003]|uniref:ATP-binding protein n=1 Tax=Georgenia sp. SUBG003 TaxID=1497974 RepID=UPI000693E85A
MSATSVPGAGRRLPLRRPREGRWVAGVCTGVAAHLGVPVGWVRLVLALTTLGAGAGALMYLWLWVTVPAGDPLEAVRPAGLSRLAPPPAAGPAVTRRTRRDDRRRPPALRRDPAARAHGRRRALELARARPLRRGGCGARLGGSSPPPPRTTAYARPGGRIVLRVGGGVALAVVGALLLIGPGGSPFELVQATLSGLAVVAGIAVVLAPLGLRLVRELGAEREARAREAERADIAAHLHDSVLQTLSMIRSRAGDNEEVARLARAQERELREWLYTDRPAPGTSTADAVRQVAAEVEDLHGVAIDVVTAGDAEPDAGTEALAAAAREALSNAVRHGRPPVSLYVEVTPEQTEVFVRDRGDGFEIDAVPADRHGVRQSIIGRMDRHGGRAAVRTRAGGTEVHLVMPRKGQQ